MLMSGIPYALHLPGSSIPVCVSSLSNIVSGCSVDLFDIV
jgi:hypothetical protein